MHWVIETRENGKRSLLSHTQSALPSITSSSNSNGILKKTSLCNILCCASGHQRQPSTVAEAVSGPRYWKMQKTNTICVPNKKKRRIEFTLRSLAYLGLGRRSTATAIPTQTHGAQSEMKIKNLYFISRTLQIIHIYKFHAHHVPAWYGGTTIRCHRAEQYATDTHYIYC